MFIIAYQNYIKAMISHSSDDAQESDLIHSQVATHTNSYIRLMLIPRGKWSCAPSSTTITYHKAVAERNQETRYGRRKMEGWTLPHAHCIFCLMEKGEPGGLPQRREHEDTEDGRGPRPVTVRRNDAHRWPEEGRGPGLLETGEGEVLCQRG
jgi:hypothetical protein|uniref:Uncharacterized protein n=1 Tax=Zea mays TaxID=4577 RepID=A0A804LDW2_MAIZE